MIEANNVWIVIAAYNEGRSLPAVLTQLQNMPYRVVVVDDGSIDDTFDVALRFPVMVLHHVANLGQGAALQTGISYALLQPGLQAVVTFDADGQHSTADIPCLLAPIANGDADVTLGSRFISGAKAVNLPFSRRLVLRAALLFTRITIGLRLTDTHNGLRAFSSSAARRIRIRQNRMAHASEILMQIRDLHLSYQEVPVSIRYTDYSLSKGQSMLEAINILWDIFSGRIR